MKRTACEAITETLKEIGTAFTKFTRAAIDTLSEMSWPALLLSCIGFAILLTIIPIALTLFVIFMIIKIAVAGSVIRAAKDKDQDPTIIDQ